jgi:hypothetical protein
MKKHIARIRIRLKNIKKDYKEKIKKAELRIKNFTYNELKKMTLARSLLIMDETRKLKFNGDKIICEKINEIKQIE